MAHVRDNILTLADATRNPICASASRLDLYSTASQRDFTVTKKGPPGPVRNEPRGEGGARQNGAPFRLVISDGPSHGYYGGFRAGKKWGVQTLPRPLQRSRSRRAGMMARRRRSMARFDCGFGASFLPLALPLALPQRVPLLLSHCYCTCLWSQAGDS